MPEKKREQMAFRREQPLLEHMPAGDLLFAQTGVVSIHHLFTIIARTFRSDTIDRQALPILSKA